MSDRTGSDYPEYEIVWRIQMNAPDAMSAARQALAVQRDLQSTATVFEVKGPNGRSGQIDLGAPYAYSLRERMLLAAMRPDGRSCDRGETLDALRTRFPDAEVAPLFEAIQTIEDATEQPPSRITREEFIRSLECLPPVDWVQRPGRESSFKLSELVNYDVARIFVRLGDEYFVMLDQCSLSHDQIVAKVRSWKAEQQRLSATRNAAGEAQP